MHSLADWDEPECPFRIEYSRRALEEIRARAIEGLLALPRVGMGTGGLLLGTRDSAAVRVLDSLEIPCSHATGPTFTLTPDEVLRARELADAAEPFLVVGWYCSKTRGEAVLSLTDTRIFGELCPNAWQILMLIRPSTFEPTRAAFCFRVGGRIVTGSEREIAGWTPETTVAVIAEAAPVESQPVTPILARHAGRPWRTMGAALLLTSGLSAAYLTRGAWLPRPELRLDASDTNGRLMLRWNREAVRGLDHASIVVTDGVQLRTIPLGRAQLEAGMTPYDRTSDRVTIRMTAGRSSARAEYFGSLK